MANGFLQTGPSRSQIIAQLLQQNQRRLSQQPNPQSTPETLARLGSTLVGAITQRKLLDEEMARRNEIGEADASAIQAFRTGLGSTEGPVQDLGGGITAQELPDLGAMTPQAALGAAEMAGSPELRNALLQQGFNMAGRQSQPDFNPQTFAPRPHGS